MANPYVELGVRSFQGIYDVYQPTFSTNQIPTGRYPVGTVGRTTDGRVFFYCRGGNTSGALARGLLYSKAAQVANHRDNAITATGGAAGQNVLSGITIGATAMTVNQYAGGYASVTQGTGQGQYFRILRHAAFVLSATNVSVTLEDNIPVALDATSKITFMKNRWDSPILQATTPLTMVGVPLVAVTQETAPAAGPPAVLGTASFAWFQTWGPCCVQVQGAGVVDGVTMVSSQTTAGTAMADNTATTLPQIPIVGTAMDAEATTNSVMIDLRICAG